MLSPPSSKWLPTARRCRLSSPSTSSTVTSVNRIHNVTPDTEIAVSPPARLNGTGEQSTPIAWGRVVLAVVSLIEMQYQVAATRAANGLGIQASFGVEHYTGLWILKEA